MMIGSNEPIGTRPCVLSEQDYASQEMMRQASLPVSASCNGESSNGGRADSSQRLGTFSLQVPVPVDSADTLDGLCAPRGRRNHQRE